MQSTDTEPNSVQNQISTPSDFPVIRYSWLKLPGPTSGVSILKLPVIYYVSP